MKKRFILAHAEARRRAVECVQTAPDGWQVVVGDPGRNLDQSAKFHAICGDLAKQKEFAGKLRTPEQWKILLISGHAVATKAGSEMMPGIEGEWCNLRESSAAMSRKRMASLIEYSLAYCAMNDVKLIDQPVKEYDL